MIIQPVFLLYISRSGSTFFANCLAKYPEIVILPELDIVTNLATAGNEYLRSRSPQQLIDFVCADSLFAETRIDTDRLERRFDQAKRNDVQSVLSAIAEEYAWICDKPNARFALFQRGDTLAVAHELVDALGDAVFIHLYRDPRACLNSIEQVHAREFSRYDAKRMGRKDAIGIARAWTGYMSRVSRLNKLPRASVMEVQYERLCQDPDAEVKRVADFVGMDAALQTTNQFSDLVVAPRDQEIHENVGSEVVSSRSAAWRTELPPNSGVVVEWVSGRLMQSRGYELYYTGNSGWVARMLYISEASLQFLLSSIQRRVKLIRKSATSPRLFALHLRRHARRFARN